MEMSLTNQNFKHFPPEMIMNNTKKFYPMINPAKNTSFEIASSLTVIRNFRRHIITTK